MLLPDGFWFRWQVLEMWIIIGTLFCGIIVAFLEQVGMDEAREAWHYYVWTVRGRLSVRRGEASMADTRAHAAGRAQYEGLCGGGRGSVVDARACDTNVAAVCALRCARCPAGGRVDGFSQRAAWACGTCVTMRVRA